jgi:hypothetical protein
MVLEYGSTADELYAKTLTVVAAGGFVKSHATLVDVFSAVFDPAPQPASPTNVVRARQLISTFLVNPIDINDLLRLMVNLFHESRTGRV